MQIRRLLRVTLEGAGFRVREAEGGGPGLAEAATKRPDAIILDLGLPDLPGIEVLKRLREWSRLPVLILSVRGQEADKIEALDAGADDYLTKPFGGGELLARLRAMLRRVQSPEEESVRALRRRGGRFRPAGGDEGGGRGEADPQGIRAAAPARCSTGAR